MHKTRLRFSKSGALRFIGHLDFLRVFGQTVRRAGLPAAFSQGFNPHLLLSFALPLALGMESVNDYADLTLAEEISCAEVVEKLNAASPGGLFVHAAYPAENKAASVVSVADYSVAGTSHAIGEILAAQSLVVPKKTKKGVRDVDIRADIFDIRADGEKIFMRLSAGSARFLNPLIVAGLLLENPSAARISRLELYCENGGLTTL